MPLLPSSFLRPVVVALSAALALSVGQLAGLTAATAAETCANTVEAGYTVRVCLTVPGGPLDGEVPVSATATISGTPTPPGIDKMVFLLGENYLLSDHSPESNDSYNMVWRTARSTVASGDLIARVRLNDGAVAEASTAVTITDAGTAAPNNNQFQVRTGTTPAPGQRFRVVSVGDAVAGGPVERQLAAQIATWNPNLLAYLGDVYERGSPYEYDNWYGDPQGFARFHDITNPTVGNHEYLTPGAAGYFGYWDNIGHYYSYNVAGWHVVTIDSSEEYAQLTPGTAQYDWLAADLAANRAHCTMVTMHHPRYSAAATAGRAGLAQVWSLLAARRVTLALGGHNHHYERWTPLNGSGTPDPQGVVQFLAGAGGHELAPPSIPDPRLVTSYADQPGALRLDLGAEDAQFSYVTVDGVVRDSGTLGCKSTGDTLPPTVPSRLRVSPVTATRAHVSWRGSSDQHSAVAGYTIRRDGVVVGTAPAGTTSYLDTGLGGGQSHAWTVDAFDTSRNASEQTAAVGAVMPASSPPRVSSRKLLRALKHHSETSRGYAKRKYGKAVDANGNGCATRAEVLLAEAVTPPTLSGVCHINGGLWRSPYDGAATSRQSRLSVGHLVPLKEAWQSGARAWNAPTRRRFANDLIYGPTLTVATTKVLTARGSAEPGGWLPPRATMRCGYLAQWVAVKWRWRLTVNPGEERLLTKRLKTCGWPKVAKPKHGSIKRG